MVELARAGRVELGRLRRIVDVDAGQLARIVHRFRTEGLARTRPADPVGQGQTVELTGRGQAVVEVLDRQSADRTQGLLAGLREDQQKDLVAAMASIRRALSGPEHPAPFGLRGLRPGDLGWVVHRHGAVYAEEYGRDERFEGEVAEAVASFAARRDPIRERAWIAELDAAPVGCVFCTRLAGGRTGDVPAAARLGLLLVEPSARGLGVGRRLVHECIAFARRAGYQQLQVRLDPRLHSARRIVQAAGFSPVTPRGLDWALDLDRPLE